METLKAIYDEIRLAKNPKATDLKKYFKTADVKVSSKDTNKRENGYKILETL